MFWSLRQSRGGSRCGLRILATLVFTLLKKRYAPITSAQPLKADLILAIGDSVRRSRISFIRFRSRLSPSSAVASSCRIHSFTGSPPTGGHGENHGTVDIARYPSLARQEFCNGVSCRGPAFVRHSASWRLDSSLPGIDHTRRRSPTAQGSTHRCEKILLGCVGHTWDASSIFELKFLL